MYRSNMIMMMMMTIMVDDVHQKDRMANLVTDFYHHQHTMMRNDGDVDWMPAYLAIDYYVADDVG